MLSLRWITGLVAGVVLCAGCGPAALAAEDDLRIDFDEPFGQEVAARGAAGALATMVTDGGGRAEQVTSRPGEGRALRLPERGSASQVVVLSVRNGGGADLLAPGERNFGFGVDVLVDAGSDADGENVVQRGLADDTGQYKIELDRGRFACTVRGDEGRLTARVSDVDVEPGVWYRVSCERVGDAVRLTVDQPAGGPTLTAADEGPLGTVRTADPGTPLSVGGKLTPVGEVAAWQPDQLNGVVDNVWLRID